MYTEFSFSEIKKSNFQKLNSCIVFFTSSDLYIQQGIIIINIKKYNVCEYDSIVIIEYDLTDKQKEFLSKIEHRIVFIRYTKDDLFDELDLNNNMNLETKLPFVASKYGRHLLFFLLNYYNKVLLLEQDMVIQGNINELFNDLGSAFAPMSDWFSQFKAMIDRNTSSDSLSEKYKLYENFYSTNCGVIYLENDFINIVDLYTTVVNLKKEIIRCINGLDGAIDELLITFIIQKYSQSLRLLDQNMYNSLAHDLNFSDDSKIVHALGLFKFWSNKYSLHFYPIWKNCYRDWLAVGGEALNDVPTISRQELYIDCILTDLNYYLLNQINEFILNNKELKYRSNTNFLLNKNLIGLSYFDKELYINILLNGYLKEPSFYIVYHLFDSDFNQNAFDIEHYNFFCDNMNLLLRFDNSKFVSKCIFIKDFNVFFKQILNELLLLSNIIDSFLLD